MELLEDNLYAIIKTGGVEIRLPENLDVEKLFSCSCYRALAEIKRVLEEPRNSDESCFMQIEEIVRVFEELGSDCGTRHDFG